MMVVIELFSAITLPDTVGVWMTSGTNWLEHELEDSRIVQVSLVFFFKVDIFSKDHQFFLFTFYILL